MWFDRIGILTSLVGFLLLIPETLYGVIGQDKIDYVRTIILRSLHVSSLFQRMNHRFKDSQKNTKSYTVQKYDKAGGKIRFVLACYWILLTVSFFIIVVLLIVSSTTHNLQLEFISVALLFGLVLISFIDYIVGSKNFKDFSLRIFITFSQIFFESLWLISLFLLLIEYGLHKFFSDKRNLRLSLLLLGIILNIVGLTIQFICTFK